MWLVSSSFERKTTWHQDDRFHTTRLAHGYSKQFGQYFLWDWCNRMSRIAIKRIQVYASVISSGTNWFKSWFLTTSETNAKQQRNGQSHALNSQLHHTRQYICITYAFSVSQIKAWDIGKEVADNCVMETESHCVHVEYNIILWHNSQTVKLPH